MPISLYQKVRDSEKLLRLATLVLPVVFVLLQFYSGTQQRLSPNTVKLSAKCVAYFAAAAVLFALSTSTDKEACRAPRSLESTPAGASGAFLRQLYRTAAVQRRTMTTSSVTLERNQVTRSANPMCTTDDYDILLNVSLAEWMTSHHSSRTMLCHKDIMPSIQPPGDSVFILDDALTQLLSSQTSSGLATPRTCETPPNYVGSPSASSDTSITRSTPTPCALHPTTTPGSSTLNNSTAGRPVFTEKKVWRHNPYSIRGYTRLNVDANHSLVPLRIGAAETSHIHFLRTDVLLKPTQPPIDLRRRGKLPYATKSDCNADLDVSLLKTTRQGAPHQHQSTPPASNPDAAVARKRFKKDCEVSRMPDDVPMYPILINLPQKTVMEDASQDSEIEGVWTTLTGLPNADGHRVAQELLNHYVNIGVIREGYSLSNDVRRMDRFNTGACHVTFVNPKDAQRLHRHLRSNMIFAAFRNGQCVVSEARD